MISGKEDTVQRRGGQNPGYSATDMKRICRILPTLPGDIYSWKSPKEGRLSARSQMAGRGRAKPDLRTDNL
ncbi:hypothetical protein DENIS_1358 [Desulfonema ishimotonii]|uniref:Uncharacterized protein n=1 Tax=Desulfonema ishimotonii TaxID=45657 RepID=A0A401FTW2_9BACT|nr:hypothetical protein DENIS_1358 [Desulfonema ishimotonii]